MAHTDSFFARLVLITKGELFEGNLLYIDTYRNFAYFENEGKCSIGQTT